MKRHVRVRAAVVAAGVVAGVVAGAALPAAAFDFGLEYAHEFHDGTIGRRRVASEFVGDGGILHLNARMHRLTLVDTTGVLLAGLAGGASHYRAKRDAVRRWASDGGHGGRVDYAYTVPAAVPGPKTRLSFAWGAGISRLGYREHAVERQLERISQSMWSLEVLIDYTSKSLIGQDKLFFVFGSDIWWKEIAVRGRDPLVSKLKKQQGRDEVVVGESIMGMVFNVELGSVVTPWLRLSAFAGWDPLIGAFALLQDDLIAPAHNWQYGLKGDVSIGNFVVISANYSSFRGGLRSGERSRVYVAQVLQLRAGVYY